MMTAEKYALCDKSSNCHHVDGFAGCVGVDNYLA